MAKLAPVAVDFLAENIPLWLLVRPTLWGTRCTCPYTVGLNPNGKLSELWLGLGRIFPKKNGSGGRCCCGYLLNPESRYFQRGVMAYRGAAIYEGFVRTQRNLFLWAEDCAV